MDWYHIFLALHLIGMVAWFSALFYLPRLFVYHVEQPQAAPTLMHMEGMLVKIIMRPAAAFTLLCGLAMIVHTPEVLHMGWLRTKLLLILILLAYHGSLEVFLGRFRRGANTYPGKFFRAWNEVPTLLLIAIILLAVLKPY